MGFRTRQLGFYYVMKKCHMCLGTDLEKFLDLGMHPHSDSFLTAGETEQPEVFYPLSVYLCRGGGLVQIGYVVDGSTLYQKNYIYQTSITKTARDHYFGLAEDVCRRFGLKPGSFVVDIGSNVGVLLMGFRERGMAVLGVDPAPNIARIAVEENGIETIPDFFAAPLAGRIVAERGRASVIAATNIFAHITDLHDSMRAVDALLSQDGVFVIEAPYLVDLLNNLEYDTIYHQHLRYLSIRPMAAFFGRFGFEVFDVVKVGIHGGSIRVFAGRKGQHAIMSSVQEFAALEDAEQVYSIVRLRRFAGKVKEHRRLMRSLLDGLKQQGRRIVGVSAPAKGNTLLNYCGIDISVLDYITEKSKLKQGLYTPGTHIPVVADEKLIEDSPEYALILAWNFADEIMANLEGFRRKGGRFIIPIPEPRIV